MVSIILVSGKTCSGKSTLAEAIHEFDSRYKIVAFADGVKSDIAGFNRVTVEELEARKGEFREALQKYGMAMRQHYRDYWVKRVFEYIYEHTLTHVVVSDVRFPNEIYKPTRMMRWGATDVISVRLIISEEEQARRYLAKYGVPLTYRQRHHVSETALDKYPRFDMFMSSELPTESQVEMVSEYAQKRRFDLENLSKEVAEIYADKVAATAP